MRDLSVAVQDLICRLTQEVERIQRGDLDDDLPRLVKPLVPRALLDALVSDIPSLGEYAQAPEEEEEEEGGGGDSEEEGPGGRGGHQGTGGGDGPSDNSSDEGGEGGAGAAAPKRARKPPRRADADVVATFVGETSVSENGPCAPAKLMELWRACNAHKMAIIFRKPVNRQHAPSYDEIIKHPMDLTEVAARIDRGEVGSVGAMRKLMNLICNNAMMYNGQGSDYYDYAVGFQDHVTEVLNAATGKVQLTPSEREERRLRRRMAVSDDDTGASSGSPAAVKKPVPKAPPKEDEARSRRSQGRKRGRDADSDADDSA